MDDDERHLMDAQEAYEVWLHDEFAEFDRSMAEGDSASAEQLKQDADRGENPEVLNKATVKERKESQDLGWRPIVFWGVLVVVILTLLTSLGLMVAYAFLRGSEMDPAVLAAWFGSAVVQVIGLLAIVTRSLFPNNGHGDL